ncbi:hypothetical protein BJX62DRAFT_243351 [Aspergillus germanicus]
MPYLSTGSSGSSRSISPVPLRGSGSGDRNGNGHDIGKDTPEPIAIVGMGCRWPGSVRSPSALWTLLHTKQSGYRPFGDHRFPLSGFYHPNPDHPGTISTRGGFLLAEDPRLFEHTFFGMTALEVETMDPAQRKLLEVVYEAFENAGETWETFSGSRTGVYVGNFSNDHAFMQTRDPGTVRPYTSTGGSISILSNRVNYIFNLLGPSVTVDTACSSSMYALHLAVSALRAGDCDAAIVAASNAILDPAAQLMMTKLGVLSATSTCHTFDASADGYARGEGFAALYLKRASDAVQAASPIRAFVRGTAINANGRTGGITHPSQQGQEAVIRQAYASANLPLSETTYFECHGTGTPVGDPIEVAAIGSVFAEYHSPGDPLLIGSIKTNLGHTESGSAIAGIMKVVLALEKGVIPPSIGVRELNPRIDFGGPNVEVLQEVTAWPAGRCKRASINSFGYGGANGHCIIDHVNNVLPGYTKPGLSLLHRSTPLISSANTSDSEAGEIESTLGGFVQVKSLPSKTTVHANSIQAGQYPYPYPYLALSTLNSRKAYATTPDRVLLPFSAQAELSLDLNIAALSSAVKNQPQSHSLADLAYTLSEKRTLFTHRTYRIVDKSSFSSSSSLDDGLSTLEPLFSCTSTRAKIGFVFTGQGAQWPAMGAKLFQYIVFQNTVRFLDGVLARLPAPDTCPWKIEDVLSGNCPADRVDVPEISQTVCTAVQVALVDLLHSWSVVPHAVVGHSSGEMAAAYAAGRISAAEAIVTAYFRGRAVARNTKAGKGAMLAVGLGVDDVRPYLEGLEGAVTVAAINSPWSVTLSGDVEGVEGVARKLAEQNVFNRMLRTGGNAYHSHHMLPLGINYEATLSAGLEHVRRSGLAGAELCFPAIPWVSSAMPATDMGTVTINAAYWRANLASPVRFSEAVTTLAAQTSARPDVLVEIGPHPALKGPTGQTLSAANLSLPYLASLTRQKDDQLSLLHLAGSLFGHNASIDLAAVNAVSSIKGSCLTHVQGCTAVDLPPYQFAYGPILYHESRLSREFRTRDVGHHDLIGSKLPGTAKSRPQWRNFLRIKDLPWLGEHRLLPDAVFPAAGYTAMAIEAATRVYNNFVDSKPIIGFSLKNLAIGAALRIPEDDHGVEIVLSAEVPNGATGKTPGWISFSVSSVAHGEDVWTEHCTGSVRVEVAGSKAAPRMSSAMDPRVSDIKTWYKKFTHIGLGYGDAFQGLSGIQADPTRSLATATINLHTTKKEVETGESQYPLHPASLDSIYQLGLIACHGGQMERMRTAYVPIHINRMYIAADNNEASGTAIARGEVRGLRGAYAQLQMVNSAGEVVLDVEQLRCASYADGPRDQGTAHSGEAFSAPLMRLVYRPDIRHMARDQARAAFPPPPANAERAWLFDKFERLSALMVAEIYDRYARGRDFAKAPDHIRYFLEWVFRRMGDRNSWIDEAKRLTSSERLGILEEGFEEVDFCSDVRICQHLFYNIDDVLSGRKTGLDVVVEDGRLHALYKDGVIMTGAYPQLERCFDSLAHANPSLNILEIGAGTGGATRIILDALTEKHGIKRYQSYTFTDITSGFLNAARESLADYKDLHFSVLDIEQDPLENGFEPVYDTVVASECLHATSRIGETLSNCRKLLRTGGKLVLVENVRTVVGMGLVLGTLPGYWSGVEDGRVDSPFLDLERWDEALRRAGFTGAEIVLDDYPAPYTTACTIVATAIESLPKQVAMPGEQVCLLHWGMRPHLVNRLAGELSNQSIPWQVGNIDEISPSTSVRVILYLGDGNLLIDMDAKRLEQLQRLVRDTPSMVCITTCGLIQGKNPNSGVALGLLRTLATENPTSRFRLLDLDPDSDLENPNLPGAILKQEQLLQSQVAGEPEDGEFVWQDGCFWVSRLVPDFGLQDQRDLVRMPASRAELMPFDRHGPVRADFETPGILTSLYFKPYAELDAPLRDDWIQVKVAAVGLNWKDMAVAAGRFDMNSFSSEYSGVVDKVGSAVTRLSPGDRVYGFGKGHFGNYVRVPAAYAHRMGDEDDPVKMASMPLVYMTAIYAFEHVTQVKAGEKVLIQSATGGLGLCAIMLARSLGAEVFCTVGTPDKATYLTQEMGIPPTRIFSSRDPADIPRLIDAAGGRGLDVILSTATGEMLHESVKALAPLGRYIDVGRVDVQDSLSLGLELFQRSTTFVSFDLGVVVEANSDMGRILMEALDRHYRAGDIGPIPALMTSDISKIDQVLLNFSKGTHIGKHVVTLTDPDSLVRMVPPAPRARFDPEAQYIITGGLGGLGRSILHWMVSRGARHILVLSRNGACSPAAQVLLDDLHNENAVIQCVCCDVSSPSEVHSILAYASASRPIRGIVHAAVSYEDLSFDKISIQQWKSGLAAKVAGTRNLHDASMALPLPLDFFVMTTSIESVIAHATQSAYTAANTFQEHFARFRRAQGLPASTVSFGHIVDLGHLSKNTTTINLMARNKVLSITEYEVLKFLEPAFLNNEPAVEEGRDAYLGASEDPLSAGTVVTCMDPRRLSAQKAESEPTSANIPRWYTDARVSLVMRAFADADRHAQFADSTVRSQQADSPTRQLRLQFEALLEESGPDDCHAIEAFVADSITRTIAEMLFVDASKMDASKTVAEYGVDSLIAAELRNWFHVALGVEVSMLDLLDARTSMRDLAGSIVKTAVGRLKE